jgi:hypothetical protein
MLHAYPAQGPQMAPYSPYRSLMPGNGIYQTPNNGMFQAPHVTAPVAPQPPPHLDAPHQSGGNGKNSNK